MTKHLMSLLLIAVAVYMIVNALVNNKATPMFLVLCGVTIAISLLSIIWRSRKPQ